jgi:monofunctional biosynthetic peptidoglycan transglycosylase
LVKKKKAKKTKRRVFVWIPVFLFLAALGYTGYFFLTLPNVSDLKNKNPGTTAMIEQRIHEAKSQKKKLVVRRHWVPFKQIPDFLKQAVRLSEDAAFYSHEGIDYFELKEAIKKNLKEGKKARGGSTITQQLAKNLYLSTEKSYFRKIKEFFIARRLERHLSKNRIFSLYLNVIEFGRGIFGVGAASEFFFRKPLDKLSKAQMLRLAAVIPKPLRVTPLSNSRYLKWRANLLLDRMHRVKYVDDREYQRLKHYFAK